MIEQAGPAAHATAAGHLGTRSLAGRLAGQWHPVENTV
jgi:hypothetical protein